MNDIIQMMPFPDRLSAMMARARERCAQVGESERLLGFTATADMYHEIAVEIGELALWAWQEKHRSQNDERLSDARPADPGRTLPAS